MSSPSPSSLVSSESYYLNYRFQVGQKVALVKLPVFRGESALDRVRLFCSAEDVPAYLHDPLLHATQTLVTDGGSSSSANSDQRNVDAWARVFRETHREYCTPLGVTAASSGGTVEDSAQTYPHPILFVPSQAASSSAEQSSVDRVFAAQFRALLDDRPSTETLLHLENSYALAVSQLRENFEVALRNLQSRQEDEMSAALRGGTSSTSSLVQRHLGQVQTLRATYARDLENLKRTQRSEYRHFVANYKRSPPSTPSSTSHSTSHSSAPSTPTLSESFAVYLGSQAKVTFQVRLMCTSDCVESFRRRSQHDAWLENARALYAGHGSGIVVLADPNLIHAPSVQQSLLSLDRRSRQLLDFAQSSTEFHFDTMPAQIMQLAEYLKAASAASAASGSSPLSTGDFVVTQHSNLHLLQCVFHVALERQAASVEHVLTQNNVAVSPLLFALQAVMSCAAQYDIATLYVPLLLMPDTSEGVLMDAPYLRRTEAIVRFIKFVMNSHPAWAETLRTVVLMLPSSNETYFARYASLLKSLLQ